MPFHCDDGRTNRWSYETLAELSVAEGEDPGGHGRYVEAVEALPAVAFKAGGDSAVGLPDWASGEWSGAASSALDFRRLTVDELYREGKSGRFRLPPRSAIVDAGYTHAWLFRTRIVDAPRALSAMLDEIRSHGDRAEVDVGTGKYYRTPGEMADEARRHGCDAVANCTGLGSREVCGDGALVGARGALLHYDRRSVAWTTDDGGGPMTDASVTIEGGAFGSPTHPCYMIPRGDVLAVGGTYLEGDDEPDVRPEERRKLVENARRMGIDVGRSEPIGEWVGLRPYRPTCRLEVDDRLSGDGLRFVHSYGYGGSGWTVFVGGAREAASLLLDR